MICGAIIVLMRFRVLSPSNKLRINASANLAGAFLQQVARFGIIRFGAPPN